MNKVCSKRLWIFLFAMLVIQFSMFANCYHDGKATFRNILPPGEDRARASKKSFVPVQLSHIGDQVVLDNGILRVTVANPEGYVTCLQYNGSDNLLETRNEENDRGYLDVSWKVMGMNLTTERIEGSRYKLIMQDDDQVEVSFTRTWDWSMNGTRVPLNIDRRYILRSGASGFYSYAIYERPEGWPAVEIDQTRIVFKLQKEKFHYMALSDDRQREMPMPEDRNENRSQHLAYPEAVLLTDPINPELKGEVDDKYQYSCENKDNKVHGWVSINPRVGFWMITPSDEFRNAGPIKQDLTSHVGPVVLGMFVSTHYAGLEVAMKFEDGEPWKKVFGPEFLYLNAFSSEEDPLVLWEDAKEQMLIETSKWPYPFVCSEDFVAPRERGSVLGRLQVRDRYIGEGLFWADSAYVGLASPGEVGSWERESKHYQFWTRADNHGYFEIKNIRPGVYNLYAWVPGVLGDYRFDANITVRQGAKGIWFSTLLSKDCGPHNAGRRIRLRDLTFEPPRDGPTIWEIGVPDRTAAEFYIPDPDPTLMNPLYVNRPDKFRQYGLWERYAELYPDHDLVYEVDVDNYKLDWFYAHVPRPSGNGTFVPTTWQIKFQLPELIKGNYKLRLALASAQQSNLQVRLHNPIAKPPYFSTGYIGTDNAIARHGIHGLYWLFNIDVPSSMLLEGNNTIFLTQSSHQTPLGVLYVQGVMYDYIRLEGPSVY